MYLVTLRRSPTRLSSRSYLWVQSTCGSYLPRVIPSHMGIGSLRSQLSRLLQNQILAELPNLIQDVNNGVKDCRGRLELFGGSRVTIQGQRLYLSRVSQNFSSLVVEKSVIDWTLSGCQVVNGPPFRAIKSGLKRSKADFAVSCRTSYFRSCQVLLKMLPPLI
jgi:hypothetical protein